MRPVQVECQQTENFVFDNYCMVYFGQANPFVDDEAEDEDDDEGSIHLQFDDGEHTIFDKRHGTG